MNYRDIIIRALKTFVQAFIPVVATAFATADLTEMDNIKKVAYSALIASTAAGISAVWNIIAGLIPEKTDIDEPIPYTITLTADEDTSDDTADPLTDEDPVNVD